MRGREQTVRRVVETGMPVVLLDRDIEGIEASRVLLDNAGACRMGVRRLHDNGYRRIELVSYDMEVSTIREREAGYADAMRELGLEEFIGIHRTLYGRAGDSVTRIVADAHCRGVDAMIFPTNTLSLMALQAMNTLGLHLPDDMAVVCFDDNEVFDLYNPTVAHIGQSVEDLGVRSFELLRDMIEHNASPSRYIVEPQFADGGSAQRRGEKKDKN